MYRYNDGYVDIEIPTMLDELKGYQYEFLLSLTTLYLSSRTMNEQMFRERWLLYLIGLPLIDKSILVAERQAKIREALKETEGFFCRDADGILTVNFETPRNLLPTVEGYQGPADWLDGMTFGDFIKCLTLLEVMSQANDDEGRLEASGEIARVMYKIPEREEVPDILLFHAPMLLRSVLRQIERGPIETNGKEIDFRIIFKSVGGGHKADDKTGWTGIAFEVASSGIFGDLRGVESSDFWAVLLYLYRCKFEYLHSKH